MLSSNSVQEVMDMRDRARGHARIPRAVPALFDGFRTSHEVAKIEQLTDDDLRA